MSTYSPLINPYLSLYAFFSAADGEETAYTWGNELAKHLDVSLHHPDDPDPDPTQNVCSIYRQHDAWVVYASVDKTEAHTQTIWQELSVTMFGANHSAWQELNQRVLGSPSPPRSHLFWGITLIFGADVAALPSDSVVKNWLQAIPLPAPEAHSPQRLIPSEQPWGMIWQLANQSDPIQQSTQIYTILALDSHAEEANNLLFAINHYDRVELSLHKCYQQLQQYEQNRDQLYHRLDELDAALETLLEQTPPKQEALTTFSTQYVEFTKWNSQILELQNTVTINGTNYDQTAKKLNLFRPQEQIFSTHLQQLKTGYRQLQADRTYYNAANERFNTGLQAVRADLELRLLKAEQQSTENWRITQQHEGEKERKEAKREKQRDLLLVLISILLALSQIWPLVDKFLELLEPQYTGLLEIRFLTIIAFLAVLLSILIGIWIGLSDWSWLWGDNSINE